jgi:hypothetical protein
MMYDISYDEASTMSTLSVRLPKDLERSLPRKDRSSWVIGALREKLRRERIREIAEDAAANTERDLQVVADWEPATAPLPRPRKRKGKR